MVVASIGIRLSCFKL